MTKYDVIINNETGIHARPAKEKEITQLRKKDVKGKKEERNMHIINTTLK